MSKPDTSPVEGGTKIVSSHIEVTQASESRNAENPKAKISLTLRTDMISLTPSFTMPDCSDFDLARGAASLFAIGWAYEIRSAISRGHRVDGIKIEGNSDESPTTTVKFLVEIPDHESASNSLSPQLKKLIISVKVKDITTTIDAVTEAREQLLKFLVDAHEECLPEARDALPKISRPSGWLTSATKAIRG